MGILTEILYTVMIPSFWTVRPGQTVYTYIRLLLEEHSDLGLLYGRAKLFKF